MTSKYDHENIRSIFNTQIEELQKKYLNEDVHDNFSYIYTGKVVDNKDSQKLGRIKVKVINLFDELKTDDIPFANPMNSFVDGAFSIPNVGDYVEVIFDHGDVYSPKYFSKALNKNQIPSQGLKDYPNTIVLYQTKAGAYCTLNKLTGEYKVVHPTGSTIKMDALGVVEIDAQIFKIKGKADSATGNGGFVIPNPNNYGGLSCIGFCPILMQPHNGNTMINNT